MSDASQGPGWWLASDGKWYPPEAFSARSEAPPSATPTQAGAQPPGAAPEPFSLDPYLQPPRHKPLHRRAWFWPLVAVLVAIGVWITIALTSPGEENAVTHQTDTVVYRVTGSGTGVRVTYQTRTGPAQPGVVPLPWTRTLHIPSLTMLNLGVTLGPDGGSVSCTIMDDGTVVASQTAHGPYGGADCASVTATK